VSERRGTGTAASAALEARTRAAMSRQLAGGLLTTGVTLAVLCGLPLLARGLPELWWWVAMSLAAQPVWVLLAVLQRRHAERLER
jgi:predicted MFS family arabinose efflux permease